MLDDTYNNWKLDPKPQTFNELMSELDPLITAQVHNYKGPTSLLRNQAKILTVKAIRSYKPDKGTKLSTWVIGQLKPLTRYNYSLSPIRLSDNTIQTAALINNTRRRLAAELKRVPKDYEIADELSMPVPKMKKILKSVPAVVSESQMMEVSEDGSGEEGIRRPVIEIPSTMGFSQDALYDSLNKREKFIFKSKTGYKGSSVLDNKTIASRLGLTPSMITQISDNITKRLLEIEQNVV